MDQLTLEMELCSPNHFISLASSIKVEGSIAEEEGWWLTIMNIDSVVLQIDVDEYSRSCGTKLLELCQGLLRTTTCEDV